MDCDEQTGASEPNPAIISARVAKLRAAIAAGEYGVDPDAIAGKMIERGFPDDVNAS